MARRVGRRSSGTRGPKNNVWTAIHVTNTQQVSTPVSADVVVPADWTAVAGFERATLLSIRGYISVSPDVEDISTGSIMFLIMVVDQDTANVDPQLVAPYTEEDILWTWGVQTGGQGAAAIESRPTTNVEINVKSMRKLTNGQEVRLMANASVGLAWRWTAIARGLLRKGGN